MTMISLPESILLHARTLPEGGVLSPGEFPRLGSRAAVYRAMSRLAGEGKLLRVARGIYVMPVTGRFGTRSPAPWKVVRALAVRNGEAVVIHGAQAANALGLTRQVPVREVYLTSGRTRKLKVGRSEIILRHAPAWMLTLGTSQAGDAVRALAWMGSNHARESVAVLRRTLPAAVWRTLVSARPALPLWMARAIGEEAPLD